ncbi:hypothetical protein GIB67_000677 [Kingdonia uniflora]|uniref:Uncharacterized protein n=1 Tax=Kingdonia uniflora TaxID=39325 RepID=A0A7J7NDD4_9MAGN|nr:hypothetical protein GIB67_000677 [Kingdonia uniflora]
MNQYTQSASPSPRKNAYSGNTIIPPFGARPLLSSQRPAMDDPNEVYRKNAINKVLESLHGDVVGLRKNREAEMDGLFGA